MDQSKPPDRTHGAMKASREMEAHAECEETPRARDGQRAWLGLAIVAVCALATAAALGYFALR